MRSIRYVDLIRRPWLHSERRVVLRGFMGRLTIALEPLFCAAVFAAITAVPFVHPAVAEVTIGPKPEFTLAQVLAPIFGLATVAFLAYAVAVIVKPMRALIATFRPIFIVDGYIRYRSEHDVNLEPVAYVAALNEERAIIAEWRLHTTPKGLSDGVYPALVEFSEYGGIHRIDGRETGVLPRQFVALGIGYFSYRG